MSEQAVSGIRRAIKELVDGTIRVQVDIDPQYRQRFFALFPEIDMPVALAPLVARPVYAASPKPAQKPAVARAGLARLAAMWGDTEDFRAWVHAEFGVALDDAAEAAEWIREVCQVDSRAALDTDPGAAARFNELIRAPYMAWREADERAASRA